MQPRRSFALPWQPGYTTAQVVLSVVGALAMVVGFGLLAVADLRVGAAVGCAGSVMVFFCGHRPWQRSTGKQSR